jgi:hypothetical protein
LCAATGCAAVTGGAAATAAPLCLDYALYQPWVENGPVMKAAQDDITGCVYLEKGQPIAVLLDGLTSVTAHPRQARESDEDTRILTSRY